MEAILGTSWFEWGSEQVASNFVVANSPNPIVLPLPTYSCFGPSELGYRESILLFSFHRQLSFRHTTLLAPNQACHC